MDICLLNAHAMYLTQNPAKVPLATFQLAVIRQIYIQGFKKQLRDLFTWILEIKDSHKDIFPIWLQSRKAANRPTEDALYVPTANKNLRKEKKPNICVRNAMLGCFQLHASKYIMKKITSEVKCLSSFFDTMCSYFCFFVFRY
ncbi:unnamed protein product [Acanthoscelides obtectus]|uniref:Uncharacterized protein n=1 Tax=Acanthoscelides obtectus TaxID=200917 RepID=A0A9P0KDQ7_ACAOB|nr:unnamed protein product [Acanthoscelides obtectus]CAK1648302.1 hypothetical protein AOBTE_LOCUS15664 [Acanthoscelides obtectus]